MELTIQNLFKGEIFDTYSILHLISGIYISGFLDLYYTKNNIFLYGFIIHLLYEVKDFIITYVFDSNLPSILKFIFVDYVNTFINSIGDQIAFCIGYLIYKYFKFSKNVIILLFLVSNIILIIKNVIFYF